MRYIKNLVLLIGIVIGLFGCEDSEDVGTTINYLQSHEWHLDSTRLQVTNSQVKLLNIDSTYFQSYCQSDDYFKFSADKKYITYSNALKCSDFEPDSVVGNWDVFSSNSIKINGNKYSVQKMSRSQLYLSSDTLYSETRNGIKINVSMKKVFYNSKYSVK